jgi:hypothetical protein
MASPLFDHLVGTGEQGRRDVNQVAPLSLLPTLIVLAVEDKFRCGGIWCYDAGLRRLSQSQSTIGR